ncbi:hypothetical protein [Serinicoccus sediminis]|uniref:hypothetical protein n=1 Tax=Serinicoccus sediminis TaxID=2306021 RepID=UPI00101F06DE|nr:hypothetical protein [Serinicoccus sediminis]
MDPRALKHAIDQGHMDRERVTTTPTRRHCRACRRTVLVALADDGPQVTGIRVTLDPRPLTPLGELQALTAGLATYAHVAGALTWRCTIRIATTPASATYDVHHTHTCTPPPGIEYTTHSHQDTFTARQYDHIPF